MRQNFMVARFFTILVLNVVFVCFGYPAWASYQVQLDYVYLQRTPGTNDFVTVPAYDSGSPNVIYPYASVKLQFDHPLTAEERLAYELELRVLSLPTFTNLRHLHEVVELTPTLDAPHGSFFWQNNYSTLIYTSEGLPPDGRFLVNLPFDWTFTNGTGEFTTTPLTGNLRTYQVIIPNLGDWLYTTRTENLNIGFIPKFLWVPCYFKDVAENKEYFDTEIKIRGAYSTHFPKKNLTVEFTDANLFTGFQDSTVTPQGDRKSVILYANGANPNFRTAPYSEKLSFDVIRKLESRPDIFGAALAPDSYYMLLVINGRFYGVYAMTENINTGDGGWSTMVDRVVQLGFDFEGAGMMHNVDHWQAKRILNFGPQYSEFPIVTQGEQKIRLPEEGTGTRTDWEGNLPYSLYEQLTNDPLLGGGPVISDSELTFKAKKPFSATKMVLKVRNNGSELLTSPTTGIVGDGEGIYNRNGNWGVSFNEPVDVDKPVNIYFKTFFDINQMDQVLRQHPERTFDWVELKSILIQKFYTTLASAYDNIHDNIVFFSPARDLEDYRDAQIPPAKYYVVIKDCDISFLPTDITYPTRPFLWDMAYESPAARQLYSNIFHQEQEPGGVLTREFYTTKINEYNAAVGNAFDFERRRWSRVIDTRPLNVYLNNIFNSPAAIRNLLSLKPGVYVPPDLPADESIAGTIAINSTKDSDTLYTRTPQVVLILLATVDGKPLTTTAQMRFSNDRSTWSTPVPFATTYPSWTLSPDDGNKTVYAQFRKDAGSGWSLPFSDTIILDTTKPVLSSVQSSVIADGKISFRATITDATSGVNRASILIRQLTINPVTGVYSYFGVLTPTLTPQGSDIYTTSVINYSWLTATNGGAVIQISVVDNVGHAYAAKYRYDGTSVQPLDTTAPSNPPGLTATAVSLTRIDLQWGASTDMDNGQPDPYPLTYEVTRDGTVIGRVSTLTFRDTTLTPGISVHTYIVKASDHLGNKSSGSTVTGRTLPPKFNIEDMIWTTRPVTVYRPNSASPYQQGENLTPVNLGYFSVGSISEGPIIDTTSGAVQWLVDWPELNAAAYVDEQYIERLYVEWNPSVNTTVDGYNLTKTSGGDDWNAGPESMDSFLGNRAVQLTSPGNSNVMLGLTSTNLPRNANFTSMEYAIFLKRIGLARVQIYELNVLKGSFPAPVANEKFAVEVRGSSVNYKRDNGTGNWTVFYPSARPHDPATPFVVDSALYHQGASIQARFIPVN